MSKRERKHTSTRAHEPEEQKPKRGNLEEQAGQLDELEAHEQQQPKQLHHPSSPFGKR